MLVRTFHVRTVLRAAAQHAPCTCAARPPCEAQQLCMMHRSVCHALRTLLALETARVAVGSPGPLRLGRGRQHAARAPRYPASVPLQQAKVLRR